MASSRLPGKAVLPLKGIPVLEVVLNRLLPIGASQIMLATTTLPSDDIICDLATSLGVAVYRGDGPDVVKRFVEAAQRSSATHIVRVTADCPFVDAESLNYCLNVCDEAEDFDLATTKGSFPVGIDYEIFPKKLLQEIHERAPLSAHDREHLTPWLYDPAHGYSILRLTPPPGWKFDDETFTLDTSADYKKILAWVDLFPDLSFTAAELLAALSASKSELKKPVKNFFSKPIGDIAAETESYLRRNEEILSRQRKITAHFSGFPPRANCLLCKESIASAQSFTHRGVDFVCCSRCLHIQSALLPPPDYPAAFDQSAGFSSVYPELSWEDYLSRVKRIYEPKLDWILKAASAWGYDPSSLQSKRWLELGCGYGFFLYCLEARAFPDIAGIEADLDLTRRANSIFSRQVVTHSSLPLSEVIAKQSADIYVAFFVLEHIADAEQFFCSLSQAPSGTLFIFSVPVFSIATILESLCPIHAARNLDAVVHTQIYTDQSIEHALGAANFEILSCWIFGQDATDWQRLLSLSLEHGYPKGLKDSTLEKLANATNSQQQLWDKSLLADSRHILARKR